MKKGINKEKEYLNCINNMIVDKNFDLARKKIDKLKENEKYKKRDLS